MLKSAPDTPLTAALLARIAADTTDIPPGVINTISSADKAVAGDAMTADPRIDIYHFTGSPGVGQRIAERAANGIRNAFWNSAASPRISCCPTPISTWRCGFGVAMCMSSSGQGCALATRMVVHADIYDEVLKRLEMIVGNLPWGDPTDPGNAVGPIIRLEQLERIEGLVDRAREAGARMLCGGQRGDRGGKGFWYLPTVVADVDENAEIAQNEVFGPVLTHPLRRRRRRGGAGRQQLAVRAVGLRAVSRQGPRIGRGQQIAGRHGQHR